jgi:hypothetical protein
MFVDQAWRDKANEQPWRVLRSRPHFDHLPQSGQTIPASNLNIIRDDLLETAPAKATAAGRHFVGAGVNTIQERVSTLAFVNALETTVHQSDHRGASGHGHSVCELWVSLACGLTNTVATSASCMAYAIIGATTLAEDAQRSISQRTTSQVRVGATFLETGLTSGSITVTAKYQATTSTASFDDRRISLFPQ